MEPGWGGKAPLERAAVFDYSGLVNTAHVTARASVTSAAAPAAARVTASAAPPLSP